MKKVSLAFPTNESLWLFKDKTKAVNVRIEPKKRVISGLFQPHEVEMAVFEFAAVSATVHSTETPMEYRTAPSKARFMEGWYRFASMLNGIKLSGRPYLLLRHIPFQRHQPDVGS